MNKISRKLLLSSLSMAFAVVALGTTTFAWFTTNATVTANITVGVQSTTDSILISTDCYHWGSSVEIDKSENELGALTYVAAGNALANDDKWQSLDGSKLSDVTIDTTSETALQFELFLKVTANNKKVQISEDSASQTNAYSLYTIQKDFTATVPSSMSFAAGDKVKVSALNALRSVVDVSKAVSTSVVKDAQTATAAKTAFEGAAGNDDTRLQTLAGYVDDSSIAPNTDRVGTSVFNFGQSLSGTNAANSYIEAVLGTNFSNADGDNYVAADANYAGLTPTTAGYTGVEMFATTEANQIYRLTFTYWLEGFDADCFDAIFGQAFSIDYSFTSADNE